MKLRNSLCAAVIAMSLGCVGVYAQEHHDDQDHHDNQEHHDDQDHHDNHAYVRHNEWRKGEHIRKEDWSRGEHIDYRSHHLKPPPRGYEWREVDGNYVLAAVATGVIASVIIAAATH